jgi:chromosome segregation ATPase
MRPASCAGVRHSEEIQRSALAPESVADFARFEPERPRQNIRSSPQTTMPSSAEKVKRRAVESRCVDFRLRRCHRRREGGRIRRTVRDASTQKLQSRERKRQVLFDFALSRERVAGLEVKVDTFRQDVAGLKEDIGRLRGEVKEGDSALRTELRTELRDLRTDAKTDMAALRTEMMALRTDLTGMIASLDVRLERRFDTLDGRLMRVIGFQIATLLVIVAGLFGLMRGLQ